MKNKKTAEYYVYIVECEGGSLYTGVAKNPHKRFTKHQQGKGAAYTRMHKPLKLVYQKLIGTYSEALKRENEIKSWPPKKKQTLLSTSK